MDNVSILYADIVGFTQMSSKKSAAELVRLLNDLFGRFDDLCTETNCEKISTLGKLHMVNNNKLIHVNKVQHFFLKIS